MNVIVNDSTRWVPLTILLLIMLIISLTCCAGLTSRAGGDISPTCQRRAIEMLTSRNKRVRRWRAGTAR